MCLGVIRRPARRGRRLGMGKGRTWRGGVAVWSCRVDWLWSVVDVDLYFECRWGILHEGLVPSALVQCGQVGGLMADQVESRREGCPLRVVLCHDECKNATRSTSAPMFRILVSALGCMSLGCTGLGTARCAPQRSCSRISSRTTIEENRLFGLHPTLNIGRRRSLFVQRRKTADQGVGTDRFWRFCESQARDW